MACPRSNGCHDREEESAIKGRVGESGRVQGEGSRGFRCERGKTTELESQQAKKDWGRSRGAAAMVREVDRAFQIRKRKRV